MGSRDGAIVAARAAGGTVIERSGTISGYTRAVSEQELQGLAL